MNLEQLGHYQKLGLFAVAAALFVYLAPKGMGIMMGSVALVANPRKLPGANSPGRQPERPRAT